MTIDEVKAKLMANDTIKVTHTYFTNDEWIKRKILPGTNKLSIEDECGYTLDWNEFWSIRNTPAFADGWEVYKDA